MSKKKTIDLSEETHITIDYDCGCQWYEMKTNEYFPSVLCADHKAQAFKKAWIEFQKKVKER